MIQPCLWFYVILDSFLICVGIMCIITCNNFAVLLVLILMTQRTLRSVDQVSGRASSLSFCPLILPPVPSSLSPHYCPRPASNSPTSVSCIRGCITVPAKRSMMLLLVLVLVMGIRSRTMQARHFPFDSPGILWVGLGFRLFEEALSHELPCSLVSSWVIYANLPHRHWCSLQSRDQGTLHHSLGYSVVFVSKDVTGWE